MMCREAASVGSGVKAPLKITESRFKGEGQERERQTIRVFPEDAARFAGAVTEMVARLD